MITSLRLFNGDSGFLGIFADEFVNLDMLTTVSYNKNNL